MTEPTRDEVNKLLAEKVMGWYWDSRSTGDGRLLPGWCDPNTDERRFIFDPMDDIEKAFQVLEKSNFRFRLYNYMNPDSGEFMCEVLDLAVKPQPIWKYGKGSVVAEAISRAVYAAIAKEEALEKFESANG